MGSRGQPVFPGAGAGGPGAANSVRGYTGTGRHHATFTKLDVSGIFFITRLILNNVTV